MRAHHGTAIFAQSDTTVVLEQIQVNAGRLEQADSESAENNKSYNQERITGIQCAEPR